MSNKFIFWNKMRFRMLIPAMALIIQLFNPKIASSQVHDFYDNTLFASINVVYNEGTAQATKNIIFSYFEGYYQHFIDSVNLARGKHMTLKFYAFYCPCDSSLYNFNVTTLGGSGGSLNPPPPPPPGPKGSGDAISVFSIIANNATLQKNSYEESIDTASAYKVAVNLKTKIQKDKVIAIMDTGLDPRFFRNINISHLIWRDTKPLTIFNFLPGAVLTKSFDDYKYKHGSAVTALILQELNRGKSYPKLMIMKVLDSKNRGTTFTVSCALSYAAQKHATIINGSFGYYSSHKDPTGDPVLKNYLDRCKKSDVIVAAGNLPLPSPSATVTPPPLCSAGGVSNKLTKTRLFFPACFSNESSNIITVTSLTTSFASCLYQNFSPDYVAVGVINKGQECCSVQVPFLKAKYEGSSFATPVISGRLMRYFLDHPTVIPEGENDINYISSPNNHLSSITRNGRFVELQ